MAEIILVWNVHTNESPVTREMALKLRENLTERGHEVRIIKYPDELTFQHLFKNLERHKDERDRFNANYDCLNKVQDSHMNFLRNLEEDNPNSMIIDLHTTWDKHYDSLKKGKLKPKEWKTKIYNGEGHYRQFGEGAEIEFISSKPMNKKLSRVYTLEIPAKYREEQRGLKQVYENNEYLKSKRKDTYFTHEANLIETRAANYLTPIFVRKSAHFIDGLAKRSVGHLKKREKSKPKHIIRRKLL
ncbi:MAG: hypothetical protein V1672_03605 [Candidatus Diapherotrites archaeon]